MTDIGASTFRDLLRSLIGQPVTIVNSESYEDAPVGHQLRPAFYRAKPVRMGEDYLVLVGVFVHPRSGAGSDPTKEPIRQYIPLARIKRVSILETEWLIHL